MAPDALKISVDSATISIETEATGELMLYLLVSNFHGRPITIDTLTIDYWLLQYQSMPEPHVVFKSAGTIVDQQASVLVKIRLYEKEIAQTRNVVPSGWGTQELLVRRALFDISLHARFQVEASGFTVTQRITDTAISIAGAANIAQRSEVK